MYHLWREQTQDARPISKKQILENLAPIESFCQRIMTFPAFFLVRLISHTIITHRTLYGTWNLSL
jgi:hypothetical protein